MARTYKHHLALAQMCEHGWACQVQQNDLIRQRKLLALFQLYRQKKSKNSNRGATFMHVCLLMSAKMNLTLPSLTVEIAETKSNEMFWHAVLKAYPKNAQVHTRGNMYILVTHPLL